MHLYKIYFWKVFHMYYNLICIFICTPICTKFYSCKKWVLHIVMSACPSLLCLYISSWTHYPLLLPQTRHSASRHCCLYGGHKKWKKRGGFNFIFLGIDYGRQIHAIA
jgi:hypothetical protein